MASPSVDRALIAAAYAAEEANREIKRERARAMDALVELLFERARYRALLVEALKWVPLYLGDEIEEALKSGEA